MRSWPVWMLFATGCMPVLKTVYGIREPRNLPSEELVAYLARKELDTTRLARVRPDRLREAWLAEGGVPDLQIFDREGRLLPYGPPGSCNAPAFDFVGKLDRDAIYETSDRVTRDAALAELRAMDGQPLDLDLDGSDFVILATWARFTGRLNVDHVRVWERMARDNPNATIAFVKVNLDPQEGSDLELELDADR